jgi:hypothetical protein
MKALTNIQQPVPESEVEHILELHAGIRRAARKALKDAIEIGDWFIEKQKGFTLHAKTNNWTQWINESFNSIGPATIYQYMMLARYRQLLSQTENNSLSVGEALRLIRQGKREVKQRERNALVVDPEPDTFEFFQVQIGNYISTLWQVRYLEAQIHESIRQMDIKEDQLIRGLEWACRDHPEVKDEVLQTFKTRRFLSLSTKKNSQLP